MIPGWLEALAPEPVAGAQPVGGGCIGDARRVALRSGRILFAKGRPGAPAGSFDVEAAGLRWLREAGAPVPEVVAVGGEGILLEWLEPRSPAPDRDERLGRDLAALHRAGAPSFGWDRPGFIAEVPQPNGPAATWVELYAEHRVLPMARRADGRGSLPPGTLDAVERLCGRLADRLGPPEPPARLHGDLWSGNAVAGPDGRWWLVDPAPFGGHREVDLAMMRLFGGFAPATFAAYDEAFPLAEGWPDRLPLLQLYPLLVHAVLFGGGYGASVADVLRRHG